MMRIWRCAADAAVTQHKIIMPRKAEFIGNGVVPCVVHMIPFSVDLHYIPDMVHILTFRGGYGDLQPVQDLYKHKGVRLADPFLISYKAVHIMIFKALVILIILGQIIMRVQYLFQIGPARLDIIHDLPDLLFKKCLLRFQRIALHSINGNQLGHIVSHHPDFIFAV